MPRSSLRSAVPPATRWSRCLAMLAAIAISHRAFATTRSEPQHPPDAGGATDRTSPPPGLPPWYDPTLPSVTRASSLIAAMSPDERISQLGASSSPIPRLKVPGYNWWSEASHGIGFADLATVFPCPLAMAATFDIDSVRAAGAVVGVEARSKHNDDLRRHNGTESTGFRGVTVFAPNINIVRDVRWGRAQETFGEDPHLTGRLGAAYIEGMQSGPGDGRFDDPLPLTVGSPSSSSGDVSAGKTTTTSPPKYLVAAVAKHVAAYSLESDFAAGGTDPQYRLRYDARVSESDLLQTYLPAFRTAIVDGGVAGIMCSYNAVNGVPMCANGRMLAEVLRGRRRGGEVGDDDGGGYGLEGNALNFDGFVVSDCGAIDFIVSMHNYTSDPVNATALALGAGVDLNCGDMYTKHATEALERGLVSWDRVEEALLRTMTKRVEWGGFDLRNPYANIGMDEVDTARSRELARKIAAESVVLLKNGGGHGRGGGGGGGALPLPTEGPHAVRRVAVVGPNADRVLTLLGNYPGCYHGPPAPDPYENFDGGLCALVTPLEAFRKAGEEVGFNVTYAKGCDIDSNDASHFDEAAEVAARADAVVFVGGLITCQEVGPQCQEAEALDRTSLGLPGRQDDLLERVRFAAREGVPVIAAVMSGSAVSAPRAADIADVVLQVFYPGEEGGTALTDIVLGREVPSGRLPVSVPKSVDDLADYLDMNMSTPPGRTYRYSTRLPLYEFGFGMSYTTFSYSDMTVTPRAALLPRRARGNDGAGRVSSERRRSETAEGGNAVTVSARLCNTGAVAASEVVQVYVSYRGGNVGVSEQKRDGGGIVGDGFPFRRLGDDSDFVSDRLSSVPLKELKAFSRAEDVRPGTCRPLTLSVAFSDLRLVDSGGRYVVRPGMYDVWIGGRAPSRQEVFWAVGGPTSRGRTSAEQQCDGCPATPLHTTFEVEG